VFQQEALIRNESLVRSLSVLCGIAHLREFAQCKLSVLGFRVTSTALIKIVLDFSPGYALSTLKSLKNNNLQLIVVTWNPCKEYMEDLWDLEPSALLAGEILQKQSLANMLPEVMDRVANGQRYRLTPGPSTPLTHGERRVLHCVAQGWPNSRIAQRLHVEEQSIKNTLRSVYRKLPISNHLQAALYYWGVPQQSESIEMLVPASLVSN
jgi:DNA-binding CsgD family transcriptional regulator